MSTKVFSKLDAIQNLRIRYLLIIDLILIWLGVALATVLRLDSFQDARVYILEGGFVLFILAPLVRLPIYFSLNLYNRLWRYAGMDDLRSILYAGAIAPVIIAYVNFAVLPRMEFPNSPSKSVWLLEALCSCALLAGSRLAMRALQQRPTRHEAMNKKYGQPTLIVGAGDAGAMMLREIRRNPDMGLSVAAFVDDDKNKHGSALFGVPVLGSRYLIPELVQQHGIQQVIIAMPTAPGKVIREVAKICEGVQIRPQIVPSLHALVSNYSNIAQLRPVDIEDLLRREPIVTDIAVVGKLLKNRRILVTGGGGSIGRELCRQILRFEPAELIILGHGENSVFEIEQELRQYLQSRHIRTRLIPCIADIRMAERIFAVFRDYQPNIVFHAAAHKHVPLMEANPCEAVTNNILGTQTLLQAALLADVERFVMISSDKAVNPTSVMGVCKRVAELLVLDTAQRSGKPFTAVRFGNVLGSRGSVVLTFKQQIAAGGPVTVTDPDVQRFFMTISEAVQLLLQAAVLAQGGEVFMLDMGEPIRIVDLANDLIRLSGLEVGRDIDIEFTGLRPGEKLYEDLFLSGEEYQTTTHTKIRIAAGARPSVPIDLATAVDTLIEAAQTGQSQEIRRLLCSLVPEYHGEIEPQRVLPLSPMRANNSVRSEKVDGYAQNGKLSPSPILGSRLAHSGGTSA